MKTAEDILKSKDTRLVTIPADATVLEAVELMVTRRIGAILVTRDDEIQGIWSERDLMRNMLVKGFDPAKARIGDYMVHPVQTAPHDTTLDSLQDMLLGLFIRHILIQKEGKNIGLISIGDVIRAELLAKDKKIRELNTIASWEYYENWGWHHKHTRKDK